MEMWIVKLHSFSWKCLLPSVRITLWKIVRSISGFAIQLMLYMSRTCCWASWCISHSKSHCANKHNTNSHGHSPFDVIGSHRFLYIFCFCLSQNRMEQVYGMKVTGQKTDWCKITHTCKTICFLPKQLCCSCFDDEIDRSPNKKMAFCCSWLKVKPNLISSTPLFRMRIHLYSLFLSYGTHSV